MTKQAIACSFTPLHSIYYRLFFAAALGLSLSALDLKADTQTVYEWSDEDGVHYAMPPAPGTSLNKPVEIHSQRLQSVVPKPTVHYQPKRSTQTTPAAPSKGDYQPYAIKHKKPTPGRYDSYSPNDSSN